MDLARAWSTCMQQSHARTKQSTADKKVKDSSKQQALIPLAAMALRGAMANFLDSLAYHLQADVVAVQFALLQAKISDSKVVLCCCCMLTTID